MSRHEHKDAFNDSNFSQVCECGAVGLREARTREWEPWHICAFCALSTYREECDHSEVTQ